jgi:hypothetical protein
VDLLRALVAAAAKADDRVNEPGLDEDEDDRAEGEQQIPEFVDRCVELCASLEGAVGVLRRARHAQKQNDREPQPGEHPAV